MAPDYRELRRRAKYMRKNMTRAETILWGKLRKRRLLGYKFRRQHILMPYIVDFYCVKAKLAVEVDGGAHHARDTAQADGSRDAYLREVHEVEVARFSNEVREHLDDVLATIAERLEPAAPSQETTSS